MIFNVFLNFLNGMMITCFKCSLTGVQHPTHLFIRHFVIIPKLKYNLLFVRKLLYAQLQFPLQFITIKVTIGPDLVFHSCFFIT